MRDYQNQQAEEMRGVFSCNPFLISGKSKRWRLSPKTLAKILHGTEESHHELRIRHKSFRHLYTTVMGERGGGLYFCCTMEVLNGEGF